MDNYVGSVQEYCAMNRLPLPEYNFARTGSDHQPLFIGIAYFAGREFHASEGCFTKKDAKQYAARKLLEYLRMQPEQVTVSPFGVKQEYAPIHVPSAATMPAAATFTTTSGRTYTSRNVSTVPPITEQQWKELLQSSLELSTSILRHDFGRAISLLEDIRPKLERGLQGAQHEY